MALKGPRVPRKPAVTVWLLTKMQDHEPLALCSTEAQAKEQVAQHIAAKCGIANVRDLSWYPAADGGEVLVYGRDRFSFSFRLEPWPVDAEMS